MWIEREYSATMTHIVLCHQFMWLVYVSLCLLHIMGIMWLTCMGDNSVIIDITKRHHIFNPLHDNKVLFVSSFVLGQWIRRAWEEYQVGLILWLYDYTNESMNNESMREYRSAEISICTSKVTLIGAVRQWVSETPTQSVSQMLWHYNSFLAPSVAVNVLTHLPACCDSAACRSSPGSSLPHLPQTWSCSVAPAPLCHCPVSQTTLSRCFVSIFPQCPFFHPLVKSKSKSSL